MAVEGLPLHLCHAIDIDNHVCPQGRWPGEFIKEVGDHRVGGQVGGARACQRNGYHVGGILYQGRGITMVRMVVIGAMGEDQVRGELPDPADEVLAVLQAGNEAAVIVIKDFVADPENFGRLCRLLASSLLQLCGVRLVVARIAVRHRDEGDLISTFPPEGCAAAREDIAIVRMGSDNKDIFHDELDAGDFVFKNMAAMIPVDDFEPAPLYQPSVYPGASPRESFLFLGDNVEVLGGEEGSRQLDERLSRLGSAGLADRHAVLCSGSNACPAQVRTKLSGLEGEQIVPFLFVEVEGATPVFASHASSYGVIPATLDDLGEVSRCHLAFFTDRQLNRVNASEGRRYELCRLGGLRLDWNGSQLRDEPLAYLATGGVLCLGGEPVRLAGCDQHSLFERLVRELGLATGLPAAEQFFSEPGSYYRVLHRGLRAAGLWRPHRLVAAEVKL